MEIDLEEPLVEPLPETAPEMPKVSWSGILLYTISVWVNYLVGYFGIYRPFKLIGGPMVPHKAVRVFGDLVTLGWFAFAFACLPWHRWEQRTFVVTKDRYGVMHYLVWWLSTLFTMFVFGELGKIPAFQTSFDSTDPLPGKKEVNAMAIVLMVSIVVYWIAKSFKMPHQRQLIFLRISGVVATVFLISYLLCSMDDLCGYHLHHWWFGFVLTLLSTTMLDNWFDYLLQGAFWAFVIESLFHYRFIFGEFFL